MTVHAVPKAPAGMAWLEPDRMERDIDTPLMAGRGIRIAGGLLAAFIVIAGIWPIDAAVIAQGEVRAGAGNMRMAHPGGGTVGRVLVRDGDRVKRNQLLVQLDDRPGKVAAQFANLTLEQLLAERARLEAERMGAANIVFPAQLTADSSSSASSAMADARSLFEQRKTELARLRAELGARADQLRQEISGLASQITALQRQRGLIEPERQSVARLWEQQLVTINRRNELERTAADLAGRTAALRAQIAGTSAQIHEVSEQSIQLGDSRRVEAGVQLAQLNASLNQQQVLKASTGDQQRRNGIRAPADGTVDKLIVHSPGDIVRPAETIMEIVPDRDRPVVEAGISPTDIDQVHVGDIANVRFTAFNRAITPEVLARVIHVAADRSIPSPGQPPFYLVRLAIDVPDGDPRLGGLRPGMPAEAHIRTGSRPLLSYLFKPLSDQLARTFRDN